MQQYVRHERPRGSHYVEPSNGYPGATNTKDPCTQSSILAGFASPTTMGKNSSKFYESKSNEDFCSIFLGKHGMDVVYGDEKVRAAAEKAARENWEAMEEKVHGSHRKQFVGKISQNTFESRMMIQQAIINDFLREMHWAGWKLLVFCNMQEGTAYGHTWHFKRCSEDVKSYEHSVSINPADINELYISGTNEKFADDIEGIIRRMSTEKGVKEVEQIKTEDAENETLRGVKMVVRHQPWDIDEFDWWGGAYLLAKLLEKLADYKMPLILQGTPGLDLEPGDKIGFVVPTESNVLRFRRVSNRVIKDFSDRLSGVWPEGLEREGQEEGTGYTMRFEGEPWERPEVILLLFDCMYRGGNVYYTGMRLRSSGSARSCMAFASREKVRKYDFACIYLFGSDTASFHNIERSVEDDLAKAMGDNWHKGVKEQEGSKVKFKGYPWNEEIYPDMMMCGAFKVMDRAGYDVIAAVSTGEGGDMFIFGK